MGTETGKGLGARAWTLETPIAKKGESGLIAHELTHTVQQRSGAKAATDAHDRFANAQTSHLLQRVESHPGIRGTPAASGRLKPRQKMVGHSVDFADFFIGENDAKMTAQGAHQATAHRKVQPAQFQTRLSQARSVLVGGTIPGSQVGQHFPNLTLKRGMTVIELEDATITHRGNGNTAIKVGRPIIITS